MRTKVAMIGVGCISGIYLENIFTRYPEIELVGVCDLIRARAEAAKEKYPSLLIYETMEDALRDPQVEVILNLTRPAEHFEVSRAALAAGKHVYSEKPLAATAELGRQLVALAEKKGLYLGGAPDTFLGAGFQTARRLIDAGAIGTVVGASAHMIGHGPESWHPDPEFFYKFGGGPMMDMGPYYITALVNLMGRVTETVSMAKASFPTRTITAKERFGETIQVDVNTYVDGLMRFESGAAARMFATFDAWYPHAPGMEIYGSEGTLFAPDPNTFGGAIRIFRKDRTEEEIPLLFGFSTNSRGLGLWDMCDAIRNHRAPRAGYLQTLHVLDVMTALAAGGAHTITSPFRRQPPLREDAENTGRIDV